MVKNLTHTFIAKDFGWLSERTKSEEKSHQGGLRYLPTKGSGPSIFLRQGVDIHLGYVHIWSIWSNYSDLTRPHPKWWFSKGNPLISGKSRLVKYYNLARSMYGIFAYICKKSNHSCVSICKYTIIHGSYGIVWTFDCLCRISFSRHPRFLEILLYKYYFDLPKKKKNPFFSPPVEHEIWTWTPYGNLKHLMLISFVLWSSYTRTMKEPQRWNTEFEKSIFGKNRNSSLQNHSFLGYSTLPKFNMVHLKMAPKGRGDSELGNHHFRFHVFFFQASRYPYFCLACRQLFWVSWDFFWRKCYMDWDQVKRKEREDFFLGYLEDHPS